MDIITGYLFAVNIVSFILYGIDKYKAKRGKWRISEAMLLTMAAIGGSVGAWTGMKVWHHKTMAQEVHHRCASCVCPSGGSCDIPPCHGMTVCCAFTVKCRQKRMMQIRVLTVSGLF